MYGVSPAFVVSMYGTGFTPAQYCEAMKRMAAMGFVGYQPEIFTHDGLGEWEQGGAKLVHRAAQDYGLEATQFVSHFLLDSFGTPQRLAALDEDVETLKRVIGVAKVFEGTQVLTIPVGPFKADWNALGAMDAAKYATLRGQLLDKIRAYHALVTGAGLKLALEVLIGSLVGGSEGFLNLCTQFDSQDFGVNLDTGHAHASREIVPLLPLRLKGRLFGLHLKDNAANENLPLAAGRGTIDWGAFLRNLPASGYEGTLDLEINCKPDEVEQEYEFGKQHLASLI